MTTFVTQSTDLIAPNDNDTAYSFFVDNETYTILANILVASSSTINFEGNCIKLGYNNDTLLNYGTIHGGGGRGVFVSDDFGSGDGTRIVNASDSSIISGTYYGIVTAVGANITIINRGSILGYYKAGIDLGPDTGGNASISNFGTVYGHESGISNTVGSVFEDVDPRFNTDILNRGTIRSDGWGIFINTQPDLSTIIVNSTTGIIVGAKHGIEADQGGFGLANRGLIVGGILDNAGVRDAVTNTGTIRGPVNLGGGNDLFNGTGGTSGPVFGGDGKDRLIGGNGNDALHGGYGIDSLTGGPGSDRFYFDTSPGALANLDSISDFRPGGAHSRIQDKIVLSEDYFYGLGPHGTLAAGHFHIGLRGTANGEIIYTPGNGFLYFQSSEELSHFATLTNLPTLHNTDFILTA